MKSRITRGTLWLTLAALFAALPPGASSADLGRGVARVSLLQGDVSVRRGDTGEWMAAAVNAPLVTQDYVYTGTGSRAELQFDWAHMLRLAPNSEVRLADLQDDRYLVQIARGTVTVSVLRDTRAEMEVSTPSVSVRPRRKGSYRITVLDDGKIEITVRSGEAEVFSPAGMERLFSGRTMLVRGDPGAPEFQLVRAIPRDAWDDWNQDRDSFLRRSQSYRYVSRDIYGAEDLDPYGRWIHLPPYGWIWSPFVAPGWAPYRFGRWVWLDYWGWSWVSYDPWGWAPYHYGRWFYHAPIGWCWYPGGIWVSHRWSPALVAFFGWGAGGFHLGFGIGAGWANIGWVPLAPYEPFYPWWGGGWGRRHVVINNVTVVNNTNIYNIYRNSRVGGAVTAVAGEDFVRGNYNNLVRVDQDQIRRVNLARGALPVAPEREALRLANRELPPTGVPRSVERERFYSRTAPRNVERVPFEQTREELVRMARTTYGEQPGVAGNFSRAEAADGVRGRERTLGAGSGVAAEGRGLRGSGADRVAEGNLSRGDAGAGAGGAAEDRSWRRVGAADPERRAVGEASRSLREGAAGEAGRESGWRRVGEPSPAARDAITGRPLDRNLGAAREGGLDRGSSRTNSMDRWERTLPAPRGGDAAGRAEEAGRDARDGWRRFGAPVYRGESPHPVERSERYGGRSAISDLERGGARMEDRGGARSDDRGGSDGWRGFGQPLPRTDRGIGESPREPNTDRIRERLGGSLPEPRGEYGSPSRAPSDGGARWQRFEGRPREAAPPSPGIERQEMPRSEPRSWDRDWSGSSSRMDRMERYESPRYDSPRGDRGGESIRINPPIVRERSAPSWDGPRWGGSMPRMESGGGMPRMDRGAPAPSPGGGGGGMPRGDGGGRGRNR